MTFFRDGELVELCQIDLHSNNTNSQETDPDSDDEINELHSESESLRFLLIKLLHSALKPLTSS